MSDKDLPRTGKREVTFGLLGVWLFITGKLFFLASAAEVASYEGIYGTLTGTVGLVVAGLFAVKGYEQVEVRRIKAQNPRLPDDGTEVEGAG